MKGVPLHVTNNVISMSGLLCRIIQIYVTIVSVSWTIDNILCVVRTIASVSYLMAAWIISYKNVPCTLSSDYVDAM